MRISHDKLRHIINVLDGFLKLKEKDVAKEVNNLLKSSEKFWGARLTKTYFNHHSVSFDLEGIVDDVLKQKILVESRNRNDISKYLNELKSYEVEENVFHIPKEVLDKPINAIRISESNKKGWSNEDLLLSIYLKDTHIYGYTSFDLPEVDEAVKKSAKEISNLNLQISFLLESYYFKNIAPYKDLQTNVYNKNYLNTLLDKISKSEDKQNYLILNIDINNLKKINDNYGHLEGDKVINYVASQLDAVTRDNEKVIRFGGDEFLVLSPNPNIEDVRTIINKIENHFKQQLDFHFEGISIGYAIGEIKDYKDFESLYHIADKMMYLNKKESKKRK